MIDDPDRIAAPIIKATSAVGSGVVAGLTANNVATYLGILYTTCLLLEFFWKKVIKPYLQRKGWLPYTVMTTPQGSHDGRDA